MKKILLLFFVVIHLSLFSENSWKKCKRTTLREMSAITGWCSDEKALLIMDLIKKNKFHCCVELGVFAGKSLFPIANALQYNKFGIVYGIDPWNALEAVNGFTKDNLNYTWWSAIDFDALYRQTLNLINQKNRLHYCKIIRQSSQNALSLFENESIDFIHIDANHNEDYVLQDVTGYFSKLKNNGYLLLTDPNWYSMRSALIFLMERADLITPFSPSASYFLFRKNHSSLKNANQLLK